MTKDSLSNENRTKLIFMFSGQGSQYYHMGETLFESDANFRRTMSDLDEIARPLLGASVIGEIYHRTRTLSEPFLSLQFSHAAIFMVQYSLVKALEAVDVLPDAVLGCSLGEFVAATVAGVMDMEAALKLVIKQVNALEASCAEGRMVAVLAPLELYHSTPVLRDNTTIAAISGPAHFVVAGSQEQTSLAVAYMRENDIIHQELAVTYAFHSSLMDPARERYLGNLRQQEFLPPSLPFISAASASELRQLPADHFWAVLRQPINYSGAVGIAEAANTPAGECVYIDVGPSGSLANLIKYNIRPGSGSTAQAIMTPFRQEQKRMEEVKKFQRKGEEHRRMSIPIRNQRRLAYVFPGQGSQKKGMGEGLFEAFPELTDRAGEVLGYSVRELCLDDPRRELNQTQFTQPATYVVNALSFLQKREAGYAPDFVAGHSLGEYSALFAAGAVDFETGLRLVKKRGELMAAMKDGGMAAVKGLDKESVHRVIQEEGLREIDMANYNSQDQVVISGPRDLILRSGRFFEAAGATLYFLLNVSGAFHSRLMQPVKEEFSRFLRTCQFFPLKTPLISNVEATYYSDEKVMYLLAEQLTSPVRWVDTILFLLEQGPVDIQEVGPGDVLTKLVSTIKKTA
jgi:trans-AT polyketide synthase/acyltransferase/oxidoreductase domain-containing protein